MSTLEVLTVAIIAYFTTGIALTGYDFSAPPMQKKMYVINQNYKMAVLTWFTWPISSIFDAYQEQKIGRNGIRFFLGVVLLTAGMFFWGKLVFNVSERLFGIYWASTAITVILLLISAPIITAIAMPNHARNPNK